MNTFAPGLWRPALCALIVASTALTAGFGTAHSAFPGANSTVVTASSAKNGLIAYFGITTENAKPEIYAFPVGGGPRVNISRNLGWDDAPALSPDGTKIVFRSVGAWIVARSDGSDQRTLVPRGGFWPRTTCWTADSRHVAGSTDTGNGETVFIETVFIVDTENSAIQRIGPGRAPRCSPRGGTVAYIGSDGLYVAALSASPVRVVTGNVSEFRWSPDGTRIAYTGPPGSVGVVEVTTGAEEELVAGAPHTSVTWSADGTRIYLISSQGSFAFVPSGGGSVKPFGPATTGAQGIEVAPSGGSIALVHDGTVTVVASSGAVISELGAGLNPSWSPDGEQLAFVRDGSLRVAEAASGDSLALTDGKSDVVYKFPYLQDPPVWRPDGSAVVAASVADVVETGLFLKQGAGARQIRLPLSVRNPTDPAWSPDGRSLAFSAGGATPAVMVDGGGRLRTIALGASEPVWSPDGSRVAYVAGANASSGIAVVGADGRGRRWVASGTVWSPAWSPDGTTIAFARSFGGSTAIYVKTLGGGPARRVFDAGDVGQNGEPGEAVSISWSPTDNRRLAFRLTSFVPAKYYGTDEDETLVIELRGKGVARVVSRMPAGTSVTWSPDGRFLLHGGNDDSFLGSYPYEYFLPPMTDNVLRVTRPDGRPVGSFTVPQRAAAPSWQPLCTRIGSNRADRIRGGPTAELLCGLRGNDVLSGGAGSDRLFGEEGNDRIDSRDGVFDVVGCGPGVDTVRADAKDLVGIDCERIERR